MSDELAVSLKNLSKSYRIWDSPASRMRGLLWQMASDLTKPFPPFSRWCAKRESKHYRNFEALKNLSFDLKKGDSLGVIGRNGSGKSTLLQMIVGTLRPTTGSVQTHGRIAALLELGSGFDRDFTGRENVFLNAAVLGLSRKETEERYQSIADFAEIGDFIEQPVRTYSSGMVVRLAFAVAVHTDPEILIVDEALSVGDARFQLKCARAIDKILEKGTTLLFVSHDINTVKRLCKKAVLLDHGEMLYSGTPNDVGNLYSKLLADGASSKTIQNDIKELQEKKGTQQPEPEIKKVEKKEAELDFQKIILTDERSRIQASGREFKYGGETGEIIHIEITGEDNKPRLIYTSGEEVVVRFIAKANEDFYNPIYALTIKNKAGVEIYGTNTMASVQPAPAIKSGEFVKVEFRFPLNLMKGDYFLSFGFVQFVGENLHIVQRRYDAIKIEVHIKDRTFGIANLHANITTQKINQPR